MNPSSRMMTLWWLGLMELIDWRHWLISMFGTGVTMGAVDTTGSPGGTAGVVVGTGAIA